MLNVLFSRSRARRLLTLWVSLAASTASLLAQSPSAADGFDPNVDGNVYVVATQPDGKVLIAGQFSSVRPNDLAFSHPRSNLARLNPDGTLDVTFEPNPNGPVRAVLIQPDGGILIAGDFTTLRPGNVGTPVTRNRIARLQADGTLDTAFAPSITGAIQPQVFALALQANGSIVVGGAFSSVQGSGAAAASARRNLARFTASGAVDAFDPNPDGTVLALALHAGGKILVGGGFTALQPAGTTAATTRNRIALLNADGTVDANFNPNANNGVTALAVQRDGKILLGGYFTTLGAAARSHLARLHADGSIDNDFAASTGGNVTTIAIAPDGAILVGGPFTVVWGRGATTLGRAYLARFTPDGTVDTTLASGFNAEVSAVGFQADGRIVVGGYFTRAIPGGSDTAIRRNRVARLNPNGTLDAHFEIEAGGRPLVSAVQADGKIIIGGSFTNVGGANHNFLARINADGTVDSTYNPTFNNRVLAAAVQTDGKLVVVGTFTSINGTTRNRIARLNLDGTLDTEFNPNADGLVGSLALQPDGRILIGGSFTTLQPTGAAAAIARNNFARLTAAGQVDTPFDPRPTNTVSSIVVQPDGKIVLGGSFLSLLPNGATFETGRSHVARLNTDGTIDTTFDPNLNAPVTSIALQGDGKLIFGGQFSLLAPPGATTATVRNRLVRINADGTIDTAFDPNPNGNVLTLAVQSDGKILVGGTFNTFTPNGATTWTSRRYIARLNTDGTVDSAFNLDLDEVSGNRVDSIRLLSDGRFLIGGNFSSLQPIGAASRVLRRNYARINANGTLDTAFDIGPGGATGALVNALAIQADGKVVAGGVFSDLGGAKTTNIARFHPEGIADTTFGTTLTADGPVNAIAVRANAATLPSQLAGLAWLNANGTLRTAFAPGTNVRLSGQVRAIAFQSDGSVLLGGSFANLSGATNGNLLRFAANGTLDTSFNPLINGQVSAIAIQADGRIIIVGGFNVVNNATRSRIARLNTDGTLDGTYDPNVNAPINSVVLQADGKAVIGGAFTSLTPNAGTTAVARNFIARLETSGAVDNAYNPTPNLTVNALALQADGKIVAGGTFTTVQPNAATTATNRNRIARFNTDGTVDTAFDPNFNEAVNVLAVQPNGDIVVGGDFTSLQPNVGGTATTGAAFSYLARVRSDGAVDRGFNPNPNNVVYVLALQADGGIIVGGDFSTIHPASAGTPVTRNRLARLNSDGSLDINFNPNVTGFVYSAATRPDGSILVSGEFTGVQGTGLLLVGGAFNNIGGIAVRNLALLNEEGSINSSFLPQPNGAINAILALSDGRFLVGGAFTTIAGASRNWVARFNADGSLDTGFAPSPLNGPVAALALQGDRILVGNSNGTLNGLRSDGTNDPTFPTPISPDIILPNLDVRGVLAVQSDGKILQRGGSAGVIARRNADGTFDSTFSAPSLGAVNAISLQSDGRILVGHSAGLARLNANGSLDTSFNPAPNSGVTALALQSDGRLMIGGSFTRVGGLARVGLARLAATGPAYSTLAVTADRTTVLWLRDGTAGEIASARFELSTDFRTWTTLGDGSRVTGGWWQLTGLQLPATGSFYVRARGIAPSSYGTSSGLYDSVREFNFAGGAFTPPVPGMGGATIQLFDPFTGFVFGPVAAGPTVIIPGPGGIPPTEKIRGGATEVGTDILHANGNVYDQVLLQGSLATVRADPGQVVRVSYIGLNNDIVQVEFSGAGSLSVLLNAVSGPMTAQNYNQPDVTYMKGHAGIIIDGADATTNVSVFSVGRITAVNQGLFRSDVSYEGIADLAYLAINSTDGRFGSVRTGNATYFATGGVTGIYAPGVQFSGPVYAGDISGFDHAVAMLVIGSAPETAITGGDLFQGNAQPVVIGGISRLRFIAGATSHGTILPAQANQAALEEDDVDVTGRVVLNPAPTP